MKEVDNERVELYLTEFAQSEHEGFVFIALYVYTKFPEKFKDNIFNLIINRSVLCNAPSWVEYQTMEALKAAFPLWNDEQKLTIIRRILSIDDKGEHVLFKDYAKNRLLYGHPL